MKKESDIKEKIDPRVEALALEFKEFSQTHGEQEVSNYRKEFETFLKKISCIEKKISKTDWNMKKLELVDQVSQLITNKKLTKNAIFSILGLLPMELIEKLYDKLNENDLDEIFLSQLLSYICELNKTSFMPKEPSVEKIKSVNTNIHYLLQQLEPNTNKISIQKIKERNQPLNKKEVIFLSRAYTLIRLKNYAGALELLQPFLQIPIQRYQLNTSILGKLLMCYKGLGDIERAVEIAQRLTKLQPENIASWIELSNLEKRRYNFEEVIRIQQIILKLDPHKIGALIEISNIYRRLGNYSEAVKIELKILEQEPKNLKCLTILSETYSKLGFLEERNKIEERKNQLISD